MVEVVEKSDLGRELSFKIGKEKIDAEKASIIKEIKKTAVVEGFRKGKVPESIIEMRFDELIKENLFKRVIPEIYFETMKEKGFNPAVEPDVFDVNLEEGELKFKVYVELKPEVKLKKYKGITVKKRNPEKITEKSIDEVLAEWEKKPEFASTIIDPNKRKAWRDKIRVQMEEYNKMAAIMEEDKQLWQEIFRENDFPVPSKMVHEQTIRYTEDYLSRVNLKEKNQEERERLAKEIFEKMKPEAEVAVKRYFVLDKIADSENIEVSESDIDERITELSRTVGESFEEMKAKLAKAEKIDDIADEIRIQKAFKVMRDNIDFIKKVILPGEEKHVETIT